MDEHVDDDSEPGGPSSSSTDQIRIFGAEPAGETGRDDSDDGRAGIDAADDDLDAAGGEDPNRFGPVPIIRADAVDADATDAVELPHWTQPATGEVPKVLLDDDDDDGNAEWASLTTSPRWRDGSTDWDQEGDFDDLASLGDDSTRVGALDTSGAHDDPDDFFGLTGEEAEPEPVPVGTESALTGSKKSSGVGGDRNLPVAVAVGAGLFLAAILVFRAGSAWAMALVAMILTLCAAEFYESSRRGGYAPATLLGLTAVVALPLAVYWKGAPAYPLVAFLSVVFSMLWYLTGNERGRTGANIGVTLLGIGYIGILGSFAALILRQDRGTAILLAAIIPTIAYDTFGYLVGRKVGHSALSAASPNKTLEGLAAGCVAAVVASLLMVLVSSTWFLPFDTASEALLLGAVVSIAAPIGDLSESLLKRDFGVKDMGSLLPGHGGFLDRFDGLLFVLPSVAYLVQVLGLV